MQPHAELLQAVQIAIGPVNKMLDALLVLEHSLLTNPKSCATLRKLVAGVEAKSAPKAQHSFDFPLLEAYREIQS